MTGVPASNAAPGRHPATGTLYFPRPRIPTPAGPDTDDTRVAIRAQAATPALVDALSSRTASRLPALSESAVTVPA